jgi:hypothetical protein
MPAMAHQQVEQALVVDHLDVRAGLSHGPDDVLLVRISSRSSSHRVCPNKDILKIYCIAC